VEPRSEAFAADYFTPAEQASISGANRSTFMAVHWSAKESALKALGIGLGIDMRRLAVHVIDRPGPGWNPLTVQYAHLRTLRGWWRQAEGVVRTIAAVPAPRPPVPIS
jgi:phosphopantetheinyl transferase (holo-ACP synthase)